MKLLKTEIDGLIFIEAPCFADHRGYFTELFKESTLRTLKIPFEYKQDNLSMSKKGVVRGMHMQRLPYAQGKLVRCLKGAIYDVAVDLRKGSSSYGKWMGVELSEENNRLLYIPEGFAHGFQCLDEGSLVYYKCTKEYAPVGEVGLRYDDPDLKISWPMTTTEISPKDLQLPHFKDFIAE